jgi:hypothetical protein
LASESPRTQPDAEWESSRVKRKDNDRHGAALGAEGAMADRGVRRIEGLDDDANSKAPFATNLRMSKIPTPGAAPRRAARGSSEYRPSAFFETAPKTPLHPKPTFSAACDRQLGYPSSRRARSRSPNLLLVASPCAG